MNPIRNPQNQFFPINVILPEKQGKISNGVKKIIITFLLLFFLFGIKEEALAAFKDGKPTGGSATVSPLNAVTLTWSHYPDASSYKIKVWGPGWRSGEVCVNIDPCSGGVSNPYYSIPAGTLDTTTSTGCTYHWRVQAWVECGCSKIGEHSKWSDWSFTTRPLSYADDICEPTPGAPGVVTGAPIECCKLNYNFEDVDENCEKYSVVASPDCRTGTCGEWTVDATTTRWSVCCFLNSLYKISDWLAWFALPLAILVSLAGAFTLATSGGNPEKVNKGRDYIVWAFVGAVLCFLIKAILAIIKTVV